MIAFAVDVAVVDSSERQRWTETVGVDDSLSRELVTTDASVLTDGGRLAHAAPRRARPRGAREQREKWSNAHQRLSGFSRSIASGCGNVGGAHVARVNTEEVLKRRFCREWGRVSVLTTTRFI